MVMFRKMWKSWFSQRPRFESDIITNWSIMDQQIVIVSENSGTGIKINENASMIIYIKKIENDLADIVVIVHSKLRPNFPEVKIECYDFEMRVSETRNITNYSIITLESIHAKNAVLSIQL